MVVITFGIAIMVGGVRIYGRIAQEVSCNQTVCAVHYVICVKIPGENYLPEEEDVAEQTLGVVSRIEVKMKVSRDINITVVSPRMQSV